MGYLSHQAKVYLADVHDHVECVDFNFGVSHFFVDPKRYRYIMSSLDMFTSIAENLINYTFNVSGH